MATKSSNSSGTPAPVKRVPLPGSQRHVRPTFQAVRPVDPEEMVRVVIKLRPKAELPDPAVLGALRPTARPARTARGEQPNRFGAAPESVDAVARFARAHNLTVEEANAGQRMVVLTGTAKDMSAAFGTDLQIFKSRTTGETYRGRVGPIHIPESLSGVVTAIAGLDNRRQAKPRIVTRTRATQTGYTPPQLAQLYNFPAQLDGTGQCIGLLEFGGGFAQADLQEYFQKIGVAEPQVTAVSVDGTTNSPGADPDVDGEVMLDIEVAGGAAPGARLAVYFAQFTEAGWVEALTRAVHDTDNRPSVLSISWGWSELQDAGGLAWTPQVMDEVNRTLQEAADLGMTVIVASGDDGSIDAIKDGKVHVDFPASSPYVLSCGGTTLRSQRGKITSELVWNDGLRESGGGTTGGGISEHFPLPAWQTGAGLNVPKSASTGFVGRGLPDVAADADARTGYIMRVDGQDVISGGTSASAPLWGALIARINQRLAQLPGAKALGYFNPLLYQTLGPADVLNDIVSGNNDAEGNLDGAYTAGPGWDACTGWGSPDGTKLLQALTSGSPAQAEEPAVVAAQIDSSSPNLAPQRVPQLEEELRAERETNRRLVEVVYRLAQTLPAGGKGPNA